MPRYTTQMGRAQAVPAHKHKMHVCEPATQLPHLHLDSSCHNSSRDQQTSLLSGRRHTLNAAPLPLVCGGDPMAHWHPSQAPSNETLDPHTLPRTHAFFHEVLVAHWLHGPTSHCFVQCPSECSTAPPSAVVHVPPPPPPPPSPTSTTTTRLADDEEPSPRLRDCCVRCWSVCATTGGPLALPLAG